MVGSYPDGMTRAHHRELDGDDHHPLCPQNPDHEDYDVDLSEGENPHYVVTGECKCNEIYDDLAEDAILARYGM